jgi:HAD superfamily hydrolase (TIGR01490 family)
VTEVAVFDLDGTITRGDTYLAFLFHVLRARPSRLLSCSGLPVLMARFALGLAGNDAVKTGFLSAIVAGCTREEVAGHAASFAAVRFAGMVKPKARACIARHAAAGDTLILATAGLDLYAGLLAERLGFDHSTATRAAWNDGKVSGALAGPNLRGEAKVSAVQAILAANGLTGARVTAYSDHHSDLPLLTFADRGVAVDPTPKLARAVAGGPIVIERWNT